MKNVAVCPRGWQADGAEFAPVGRLHSRRKNGHTTSMNELSPIFDAPAHRLNVAGGRMAYRDVGPSSAGDGDSSPDGRKTILCVHGNPTWSYYFRSVAQRFGDRHRVVIVDHIGCGLSDKPPRRRFGYHLADHQANLVRLIEHLDLRHVVLLAHDWGGAIGLGSLVAEKARFDGMVLLNTAAFPPPFVPWRIAACRIPLLGTLAVRGANLFALAAVKMAMNRNELDQSVAEGLLQPYDNWAHRVAVDAFVRDIPLSRRHPTYQTLCKLERDLPGLADLPSLLVWGMKDWCFRPECLRRFQDVWPNARAVEIADAGHYVIEDAPEETLAAIAAFLHELQR